MKTQLLLPLLVFLIWGCKENTNTTKPEAEQVEEVPKTPPVVSTSIKALLQFADLTLTDTTDVNSLLFFKQIDASGTVSSIDVVKATDLYAKLLKPGQATTMPIFEIKSTDTAILPIQGKGFGGAIWANVLVDKKTLEIKKVAFDHKAESEGYGAAMTQNSFENQFVGTKISFEQNTFSLEKAVEKAMDDGQIVDGISGATMTSRGVVEMMNDGLRQYRRYLGG